MRKFLGVMLVTGVLPLAGCPPKYPNCETDEDCKKVAPDEWCVNNLCVKCRDDRDCRPGQECREGACRDIPGYCDAERRCPMGQVCRDNRCSPCLNDEECGPGMRCDNGTCVPLPECDEMRPCPAGEECVNGFCRPIPPPPAPQECQFTSIFFDFDRHEIRRDQRDAMRANQSCLSERNRPVRLTGYCDERGTEEYNMALGQRRADSVRRYLTNLGVPRAMIRGTDSRGKLEARRCYDEACWQRDRRVDFRE